MEHIGGGVTAHIPIGAVCDIHAQHVIGPGQVIITQRFRRLGEGSHRFRVIPNIG